MTTVEPIVIGFCSMLPQFSLRQLRYLRKSIKNPEWWRDEQLWTFIVSAILAEQPEKFIPLFCGTSLTLPAGVRVWCEAEPPSTRHGNDEGNTILDLAFGHIEPRSSGFAKTADPNRTEAGIRYGPIDNSSGWVCFVEAKLLSDCGCKVTHDPARNQLARVLENLLCFQTNGQFVPRLFFALLTPSHFRDRAPKSRLYWYKMNEYQDRRAIAAEIGSCGLRKRTSTGYKFPDVDTRLKAIERLQWVTFEDVLEVGGFGSDLDIACRPNEARHVRDAIEATLALYPTLDPPGSITSTNDRSELTS